MEVQKNWRERLLGIPGYTSLEEDCKQVKTCVEIALKCIDEEKQRRPNIGYIVDQLAETRKHEIEVGSVKISSPVMGNVSANFVNQITRNYSPELQLHRSSFGVYYKGILPEGGGLIAVKKVSETAIQNKVFDNEITKLIALQHKNIVHFVGYCYETKKVVVVHNGRNIIADMTESCLCYEYLSKGNLQKCFDEGTRAIDWNVRFKIIKGICNGLHFLHKELDRPLVHLNLVPTSIWLDHNWEPKIAEFGLSRTIGQDQSRINTMNVVGDIGYMAPEYLYRGEISTTSDIYSLGMLIIEITTGEKNNSDADDKSGRRFVNSVIRNWTDSHIISKYAALDANGLQQVKACIVIGLMCLEIDHRRRPSIVDVMRNITSAVDLNKRSSLIQIDDEVNGRHQTNSISTDLLDIYPPQICFPFKPNLLISCSLQLSNKTDDHVAVRLLPKIPKRYIMAKKLLSCIVPPKSSYTIIVIKREQEERPPPDMVDVFTLESSIVRDCNLSQETANDKVYQLTLNVVSDPLKEYKVQSEIELIQIISMTKYSQVLSMDVHPTEPWIVTSHYGGNIYIWDYQALEIENSFGDKKNIPVYSAKFVERKEWLLAGDGDGTIFVYSYDTEQEIKRFEAHDGDITYLAVHPTQTFMLSSSDDHLIKLWDWENGWECTRIFEGHSDRVTQVTFNPMDSNSFASASLDHTIKIWDISSPESKLTLTDHPDGLLCLHNYTHTRQYLITGSMDGTAQIWDMDTGRSVHQLKGHVDSISSVYGHPELPLIITGSHDGTVRLWNSTTYSLENTIAINLGAVYAFGYIEDLKRIVVSCQQGVTIMEINLP